MPKLIPKDKQKIRTNFTLSPEARRLLREMSEKLGVSMTAVLELSIRGKAKEESVQ